MSFSTEIMLLGIHMQISKVGIQSIGKHTFSHKILDSNVCIGIMFISIHFNESVYLGVDM